MGPTDAKNRPSEIPKDKIIEGRSLKQKASQMWCLLRLLPFMLGPLIPTENPYWYFYLDLREIMDILFSPKIRRSNLISLEFLIADHLIAFKDLFPTERLIPKHHFLVHYPRLMKEIGPVQLIWAMKYCKNSKIGPYANIYSKRALR